MYTAPTLNNPPPIIHSLFQGTKKVRIGYWDYRGKGEYLKLMLNYLKIDYDDVIYETEDEWEKDKGYLPAPFPSLPYIQDGKYFLTDFVAIIEYLAAKYNPRMAG